MSPLRRKFEAEAKEYFAKYGYKRRRTSSGGYLYVKEYSENESMGYDVRNPDFWKSDNAVYLEWSDIPVRQNK